MGYKRLVRLFPIPGMHFFSRHTAYKKYFPALGNSRSRSLSYVRYRCYIVVASSFSERTDNEPLTSNSIVNTSIHVSRTDTFEVIPPTEGILKVVLCFRAKTGQLKVGTWCCLEDSKLEEIKSKSH